MSTTGHTRPGREAGFTIVEVMMAMVVLVVGMLGVSLMLSQASQTTADNKARGQALSLARELTEGARSQAYTNLEPTTVVGLEQANSALADSDPDTAGWQVERRGKTFNVAVGVCSVDDINDGSGTRDTATFCASGGGSTSSATCQEGYGSGDSIAGNGTLAGVAVGDCGLDTDRDGRVDGLTGRLRRQRVPGLGEGRQEPRRLQAPRDPRAVAERARADLRPAEHHDRLPRGDGGARRSPASCPTPTSARRTSSPPARR